MRPLVKSPRQLLRGYREGRFELHFGVPKEVWSPEKLAQVEPMSNVPNRRNEQLLADTVTTLSKEHGWAAGCVFRYNANESIVNEFPRPAGAAVYSFVNDAQLRPAVVLYVEGATKASGSYREHAYGLLPKAGRPRGTGVGILLRPRYQRRGGCVPVVKKRTNAQDINRPRGWPVLLEE